MVTAWSPEAFVMKVHTLAVPPPPERKPEPPPAATAGRGDDGRGFAKAMTAAAVSVPVPTRKPVPAEVRAMTASAAMAKPDPDLTRMAALPTPTAKPDTAIATAPVAPPEVKPGSAPPPMKPDAPGVAVVETGPPVAEKAVAERTAAETPASDRPALASAASAPPVLPGRKPTPPDTRTAEAAPAAKAGGEPGAVATEVASASASSPVQSPIPGRKPDDVPPASAGASAGTGAAETGADRVILAARMVAGPAGVNLNTILAQATQESGLKLNAKSRTSSATGPFQFLERTWLDMFRRHGAAYGLGDMADAIKVRNGVPMVADKALRKKILDLRQDPDIAAGMAARLLSEGRNQLEGRLKRPVSESETRLAYVFGVGGAMTLIRGAEKTPNTPAADLLPKAAKANHSLFHDRKTGQALSVRDTLDRMTRRMNIDHGRMFEIIESMASPERLDGGPSPFNPFQTASDRGNAADGDGAPLAASRKPV